MDACGLRVDVQASIKIRQAISHAGMCVCAYARACVCPRARACVWGGGGGSILRGFPKGAIDGLKGNRYVTTLHAIVSGIRKLARVEPIPDGRCVYRGLGGMLLPSAFHDPDALGCMGGVERAFMSTTTKRAIAVQYSGNKTPTIFQISIGQIDMGASLNVLSQYAGEEEILMPPLSNLEVLPTYIHTYIHTYTHTYIHAYIHTYLQHTYM